MTLGFCLVCVLDGLSRARGGSFGKMTLEGQTKLRFDDFTLFLISVRVHVKFECNRITNFLFFKLLYDFI